MGWEVDTSLVGRLALKYAFRTGIEYEELYAEALEGWCRAKASPQYDPTRSSFRTFASIVIDSRLKDYEYAHRRKFPATCELDEAIPDTQPNPEEIAIWNELVRQLPKDGEMIYRMMMGVHSDGVPAYRVRASIRKDLRARRNWPAARIDQALNSVKMILSQI